MRDYISAAHQGDAYALDHLGMCCKNGIGVIQDYETAIVLFKMAAARGNASAQYHLGVCYANDHGIDGTEKDPEEAFRCFDKAAKQGNTYAECQKGLSYAYGNGIKKHPKTAVECYRNAAKRGNFRAQYHLGVCYANGYGTKKDLVKAIECYRSAAEQGVAPAKVNFDIYHAYVMKTFKKVADNNCFLKPRNMRVDEYIILAKLYLINYEFCERYVKQDRSKKKYIDYRGLYGRSKKCVIFSAALPWIFIISGLALVAIGMHYTMPTHETREILEPYYDPNRDISSFTFTTSGVILLIALWIIVLCCEGIWGLKLSDKTQEHTLDSLSLINEYDNMNVLRNEAIDLFKDALKHVDDLDGLNVLDKLLRSLFQGDKFPVLTLAGKLGGTNVNMNDIDKNILNYMGECGGQDRKLELSHLIKKIFFMRELTSLPTKSFPVNRAMKAVSIVSDFCLAEPELPALLSYEEMTKSFGLFSHPYNSSADAIEKESSEVTQRHDHALKI